MSQAPEAPSPKKTATHHLPVNIVGRSRRVRTDLLRRASSSIEISEVGSGIWERGHVRLYSQFQSEGFPRHDILAFAEAGLGLTNARQWREWGLPGWLLMVPVIIKIELPRLKSAPQEDRSWVREIQAHKLLDLEERHGLDLKGLCDLLKPILSKPGIEKVAGARSERAGDQADQDGTLEADLVLPDELTSAEALTS
jgi:hypothetical protein